METDKENSSPAQKRWLTKFKGIEIFAIKTGIVLIGIFILVNFLLPDFGTFEYKLEHKLGKFQDKLKRLETPKSKLILLSFVQNPQALLKVSEIEESEGKIDNAIREMELAIGLLEMHGADKQVMQKYTDRVKKLTAKKSNMAVTPAQDK